MRYEFVCRYHNGQKHDNIFCSSNITINCIELDLCVYSSADKFQFNLIFAKDYTALVLYALYLMHKKLLSMIANSVSYSFIVS